jgi:hypothetical protein
MDTNSKHQKDAVTTDQKIQDEHLRELDKQHFKESEKDAENLIPKKSVKTESSRKS